MELLGKHYTMFHSYLQHMCSHSQWITLVYCCRSLDIATSDSDLKIFWRGSAHTCLPWWPSCSPHLTTTG